MTVNAIKTYFYGMKSKATDGPQSIRNEAVVVANSIAAHGVKCVQIDGRVAIRQVLIP